ncbi:Centrosomal protein of 44 kDa [Hondaea fermentalgiana]|uniref:Centrosomal protein of 44 kDa n=1 Tax=Hondaea fermentalgiana TaxID=2315210 RepID=A0A2R5GVL2_9STRA|nr:Centrosomal protein of 44 kDa [Hondaea fermentalgiana]|eukprot:GBG34605.1 Centrosomal protein of 44 kDa [Hondaea fermentalgiana]
MAHAAAMTGDLRNNLEKLRSELRGTCVKDEDVDLEAVARGEPTGFLPLLHKVLLDDSLHLARYLSERGYQLYPIQDRPFLEGVFRVVRNEFSYRPSLTLEQFLSSGFAERKIIFVCDVVKLCRRKADELVRLQKAAGNSRTPPSASSETSSPAAASINANVNGTAKSSSSSATANGVDRGGLRNDRLDEADHRPLVKAIRSRDDDDEGEVEIEEDADFASSLGSATSGGSWRSKRTLTLQTGGDGSSNGTTPANGNGPEELKSPTSSSGPVSPVSITSAASAPAVFRQAPIRVKADMRGHLHPHTHQFQHHLQTHASSQGSSSATGDGDALGDHPHAGNPPYLNVNNAARGLECWVSSPPQLLDRPKRKEALAAQLNKPHTSPRIHHGSRGSSPSSMHRTNSVGSLSAGSKRGGSVAAAAAMMARPKSGQSSPVSATKVAPMSAAFGTRGRAASSQGSASPHQLGATLAAGSRSGRSFSPAKDRSGGGNIARKLKLPSGSSANGAASSQISTPSSQQSGRPAGFPRAVDAAPASVAVQSARTTIPEPNHEQDQLHQHSQAHAPQQSEPKQDQMAAAMSTQAGQPDLSMLVTQMNKIAMAFESVAHIPERFDAMEKRINTALQTMDRRISEIDSRVRQQVEDSSSNGASSIASASSQSLSAVPQHHRLMSEPSAATTVESLESELGHSVTSREARGTRHATLNHTASAARGSTSNGPVSAPRVLSSASGSGRSGARGTASHARSSASQSRSPATSSSADAVSRATEGIDDFIKVIEERFRETETVLAESEN